MKTNKKIYIKFSLLVLGGLIVGGICGFFIGYRGDSLRDMFLALGALLEQNSIWLLAASYLFPAVSFYLYRKGKRCAALVGEENEEMFEQADRALGWALGASSVALILGFVFYGMSIGFLFQSFDLVAINMGLVLFVALIVIVVAEQNAIVKATQALHPEKNGSVFDTKFQKKWFESCDEAEKLRIGRAAYRSMQISAKAYPLWFVILCLGNLITPIGVLPFLVFGSLWLVQTQSYQFAAMKRKKCD